MPLRTCKSYKFQQLLSNMTFEAMLCNVIFSDPDYIHNLAMLYSISAARPVRPARPAHAIEGVISLLCH